MPRPIKVGRKERMTFAKINEESKVLEATIEYLRQGFLDSL